MKAFLPTILSLVSTISLAAPAPFDPRPERLNFVAPKYPSGKDAYHTCHTGYVELSYIIEVDGSVDEIGVLDSGLDMGCTNRSANPGFFHKSATTALEQWRYTAISKRCQATEKLYFEFEE